ncbi:kinase-like domain-containing protein [Polychytrium aggregatum]|uniref:kinase-like domain-containing protein n=1 Tax=Polychytrium aggregatum TaxID=110093 RepID=UPI0022FEFECC|nr:kinase-like domain-containing protein [Polychytrium aggregatum]KAI9202643.1 kinase-like domain-containing protein [Polychytrium aggregatum]
MRNPAASDLTAGERERARGVALEAMEQESATKRRSEGFGQWGAGEQHVEYVEYVEYVECVEYVEYVECVEYVEYVEYVQGNAKVTAARALHLLAKQGDLDSLKFLVESEDTGEDIRLESRHVSSLDVDESSNTLLHTATQSGHLNIVEWLLGQDKIDVNAQNASGDTALILSVLCGSLELTTAIISAATILRRQASRFAADSFVSASTRSRNIHGFGRQLLRAKADANVANDHGNTPLHYACFWRYEPIALALVIEGAAVVAKNKYQRSPFDRTSDSLRQKVESAIGSQQRPNVVVQANALQLHHQIESTPRFDSWKGHWSDYSVFIKLFKDQGHIVEEEVVQIRKEISTVRKLYHPNLCLILGACLTQPNMCIFTEFMEHGSLHTYVYNPEFDLSIQQAIFWAIGICEGLCFLHTREPAVAHGNLKSKNILIHPDGRPLLSEYGFQNSLLARHVGEARTGRRYDVAWLSPESIQEANAPGSMAADVYATAIVLYEIFVRQSPFEELGLDDEQLATRILEGVRPDVPDFIPASISDLLRDCWRANADQRPKITDARDKLKELMLTLQPAEPVDPSTA